MPFNIPFVNNFDIFSYFIPGAFLILLLILPLLLSGQFETNWITENTTLSVLLFLFSSYLIGHFIQSIRKFLGIQLIFHNRILIKENSKYAEKARRLIAGFFFGDENALEKSGNKKGEDPKNRQDMISKAFHLTYRTVATRNLNPHTDLLNGLYHMHLGLWIASLITITVLIIKEIAGFFIIDFNIIDLIFFMIALLVAIRVIMLSLYHLKKHSEKDIEKIDASEKEPVELNILKWALLIIVVIFIAASYFLNLNSIQFDSLLCTALILFAGFILIFSSERATYFAQLWAYGIIDAFYSNYIVEEVQKKKSGRKK